VDMRTDQRAEVGRMQLYGLLELLEKEHGCGVSVVRFVGDRGLQKIESEVRLGERCNQKCSSMPAGAGSLCA
jgi:hypothetical protein